MKKEKFLGSLKACLSSFLLPTLSKKKKIKKRKKTS